MQFARPTQEPSSGFNVGGQMRLHIVGSKKSSCTVYRRERRRRIIGVLAFSRTGY